MLTTNTLGKESHRKQIPEYNARPFATEFNRKLIVTAYPNNVLKFIFYDNTIVKNWSY